MCSAGYGACAPDTCTPATCHGPGPGLLSQAWNGMMQSSWRSCGFFWVISAAASTFPLPCLPGLAQHCSRARKTANHLFAGGSSPAVGAPARALHSCSACATWRSIAVILSSIPVTRTNAGNGSGGRKYGLSCRWGPVRGTTCTKPRKRTIPRFHVMCSALDEYAKIEHQWVGSLDEKAPLIGKLER
jgi:hypothetical protein